MFEKIKALEQQKVELEKEIAELAAMVRADALAKIAETMSAAKLDIYDVAEHLGVKLGDVKPVKPLELAQEPAPAKPEKPKLAAKFLNPETGESWTGRGLRPKWLTHALAEGKSLEDFAVVVAKPNVDDTNVVDMAQASSASEAADAGEQEQAAEAQA